MIKGEMAILGILEKKTGKITPASGCLIHKEKSILELTQWLKVLDSGGSLHDIPVICQGLKESHQVNLCKYVELTAFKKEDGRLVPAFAFTVCNHQKHNPTTPN